ncbi:signal-regulatory protein beta-1-like isoform X2 [Carettochelys insculpta]|uniref:signal-regulatory protein beta-1-like isoform X2 n=1 Tax=Carettochelys insculpta TaxID=44489 RepID=UPI003EC05E6C
MREHESPATLLREVKRRVGNTIHCAQRSDEEVSLPSAFVEGLTLELRLLSSSSGRAGKGCGAETTNGAGYAVPCVRIGTSRPGAAASPGNPCLPQPACSLPAGPRAQEFQVLQPQGAVSVSAGGTLTLNCSATAAVPVGPMKWFKGSGPSRQLVFEDRDKGSFPRVSRALPGANTDFTIHISDTRPEDAGTYRCVKFRKVAGGEVELSSGPGTVVSVSARPSAPSVSGPPSRAEPGAPVSFTCTSEGFSPRDITVTWFKNGDKLEAPRPQVLPEHENVSYSVSSTVGLSLSAGDARSQLTCQLEHSTLPAPLRGTYSLNRTLRVPPQLRVDPKPEGPVPVNTLVTFTCCAEGFYPSDVSLSWLQNGNETRLGKSSPLAENADGRYTLQSSLEVNATEQMDQSNLTCQVVHDSQPPINISKRLHVSQPNAESGESLFSSPVLWIGLLLDKALTGAFLLFLFLRSKV